jgi:hypothetical protein
VDVPLFSNIEFYEAIAKEALATVHELDAKERHPKPDESSGHVITWDPERRSFKNSLIAIAFASMWLEALLLGMLSRTGSR